MKRLVFLGFSLLAFFLPLTCQARLGDSIARLQQRYGKALGKRGSWFLFKEEGYMFEAYLIANTCEILIVARTDKNELSQSERYVFLNKCLPDFKNVEGSNSENMRWENSSNGNIAVYDVKIKSLTFTSKKAQTLSYDPYSEFSLDSQTSRF